MDEVESEESEFDAPANTYKILIVGNAGVGKTAFLMRFCDNIFLQTYFATVGIDFRYKTMKWKNRQVILQIWDTAGQERFRTFTTAYYRGAAAFILMFDLTNEESFHNIRTWATSIQDYLENAIVVLVGNKSDLTESRVVTPNQCRELIRSLGFELFETSAKDAINVEETFEYLVEAIMERIPSHYTSLAATPEPHPRGRSRCAC